METDQISAGRAPAMLADACRKLLTADEMVTFLRELLGELVDALHDEMCHEVGQNTHVINRVEDACRELGDNYMGYVGTWF